MKNQIAKTFYDKPIQVLTANVVTDDEGGIMFNDYVVTNNFKGNVSFSNCKRIQEEYGLDYNIDISITTDYELLRINDLIRYQDITYNVTDILPSDSHFLIVATKWRT